MSGSPVSLEAGNAVVGQRVLHRIHEDLEGDGRDVSTGESALGDVLRLSDGGSDDLRLDAVKLEDLGDGLDQFDAVPSDVIDAANEGGNEGSTGARSEQSLVGREDQGDIGTDTGLCETLHRFPAFCGHRDLDDDMRVKGSEDFAFVSHEVPTVSMFIAAGSPEQGYCYGQHHPKVKFDDSILYEGSAAFCWFALRWLKDKS